MIGKANRIMRSREFLVQAISLLFLIIASLFSVGFHHPDEHWQILEFAASEIGWITTDSLPWEYSHQMRSAFQPSVIVVLYKTLAFLGIGDPFSLAFASRLLSALLFFSSMLLLYCLYRGHFRDDPILSKLLLFGSFLLWFLIYNGVRFSSENWSGIFFLLGFASYFLLQRDRFYHGLLVGGLFGFSFLCRFQAGFMILGFLAWAFFIGDKKPKQLFPLLLGSGAVFFLGMGIDRWFYGEWTLTAWNYLDQNLFQDQVSRFGTQPWWFYFREAFLWGVPPFSLLFVTSPFLLFMRKKDPLLWVLMPFLLVHFLIGHKELRFLFPLLGLLPVVSVKGLALLREKGLIDLRTRKFRIFMGSFLLVNALLLLWMSFRPANTKVELFEEVREHRGPKDPLYYLNRDPYNLVLDIGFYKASGLRTLPLKEFYGKAKKGGPNEKLLIASRWNDRPAFLKEKGEMLMASYPRWVLAFDINGWKKRTTFWCLYRIERKDMPERPSLKKLY